MATKDKDSKAGTIEIVHDEERAIELEHGPHPEHGRATRLTRIADFNKATGNPLIVFDNFSEAQRKEYLSHMVEIIPMNVAPGEKPRSQHVPVSVVAEEAQGDTRYVVEIAPRTHRPATKPDTAATK